ncbi:MAG: YdcF family protein [Janthinobacterium lividum]
MFKLLIALVVVFLIAPLGKIGVGYLENYYPRLHHIPKDAQGIILLGGSFDMKTSQKRGFTCYNMAAGRLVEFMELAHKHPHLPLIFTGGGTRDYTKKSEADLTEEILKNMHFDLSRIKFERKSLNTLENATLTFDMIHPKPHEKWVLVTSASHMPRSVALFRHFGWHVIPYPVDYHTDESLSYQPTMNIYHIVAFWYHGLHEWLALIRNYVRGHSETLLPARV